MPPTSGHTAGAVAVPALLLLADGRFPAGGHAHSGGVEAAVEVGDVRDVPTLELFLRGRLATTGLVAAAFAAATCAAYTKPDGDGDEQAALPQSSMHLVEQLDHELDARMPSPALRDVSRRLGRQLLRAGGRIWPRPALAALLAATPQGLHHPVALGAVAAAAGLDPAAAALAAAHDATTVPATAAVRLLGLDPFSVHATLARLASLVAAVAADGAGYATTAPARLPACSGPLLDIRAQHHATWEVRLFAS